MKEDDDNFWNAPDSYEFGWAIKKRNPLVCEQECFLIQPEEYGPDMILLKRRSLRKSSEYQSWSMEELENGTGDLEELWLEEDWKSLDTEEMLKILNSLPQDSFALNSKELGLNGNKLTRRGATRVRRILASISEEAKAAELGKLEAIKEASKKEHLNGDGLNNTDQVEEKIQWHGKTLDLYRLVEYLEGKKLIDQKNRARMYRIFLDNKGNPVREDSSPFTAKAKRMIPDPETKALIDSMIPEKS